MHMNLLHDPLQALLFQAGELLLTYYGKNISRQEKPDGSFFTIADVQVEQFLIKKLLELLPNSSIIAEESGFINNGSDYTWIIDPLDGTTNFIRKIPYFCSSIALAHKGIIQVGAIYDPVHQEFYFAAQNSGAYCNQQILRILATDQASCLIGLPSLTNAPEIYRKIAQLGPDYSFRRFGALALDCAAVAASKLDAVIGLQPAWWDIAAGKIIIEKAGGCVTDGSGHAVISAPPIMIAGRSSTHTTLIKAFTVC